MFQEQTVFLRQLTRQHLGIKLSDLQVAQFCKFGDLLLAWNQRFNLTRITAPSEVVVKHFIDSMALGKFVSGLHFADLGTGAGFPGIPLKILLPDLEVVLIDSLKKRLKFIEELIQILGLNGVQIVHSRIEDIGHNLQYRGYFDTVASRAVARLPVLLEYALPLLKLDGFFLAPKGAQFKSELREAKNALFQLGGAVEGIEDFHFGEMAEKRIIIQVRKIKETPSQYPRQAGIPAKRPIC